MRIGVCVLLTVALVVVGACADSEEGAVWLESPDGRLTVAIAGDHDGFGPVTYRVDLDGSPLLADSRVGLRMRTEEMEALAIVDEGTPAEIEDRYRLVGEDRDIVGRANERRLAAETVSGTRVEIVFRVYDDAVAVRYVVDADRDADRLVEDLLEFTFAEPGKVWIQPHDLPGLTTPAYEAEYINGLPIGHRAPVPSWNVPALFETGGRWVLLTESDLSAGNYGGHLQVTGDRTYQMALPQPSEGLSRDPGGEPVTYPWTSPWRVIVAGSDLADVAVTDAITHLASPAAIPATFVQPGRVSWSWWSDHSSPRNPEALREFVDLAAEFGWEHTLIDANWNLMPEADLRAVIDYAAQRGVGVFLWYNSGGPNNQVTEQPRDRMHDPAVRKSEFARLAEWGVRGVKVDFFHSDRVPMIERYLAIAADAAEAGLMVNFHGSTIPRGWERTWPNLMTMEGVRGAEQYGFAPEYPEAAVWHNAILPFTRNVAGPMDYTPVTFSDQAFPHLTTNGHELALAVVYESRLQHFADSAASYRSLPEPARAFLTEVPATWDESRLLGGYPGELAVFARRSGSVWFVGGIGGSETQEFEVDFSFLEGPAEVTAITDPDFSVEQRTVEPGDVWTVEIPRAGGFVMTVRPAAGQE